MNTAMDSDWMLTKVKSSSSSCTSLCVIARSEAPHDQRLQRLHFYDTVHTQAHTFVQQEEMLVLLLERCNSTL